MALTQPLYASPEAIPAAPPEAIPAAPREGMTPEEFQLLCGEDEFVELVRGEVISVPPAGEEHGDIEVETLFALKSFVNANDLGKVWPGDVGFILERDPFTVRCPDVAFVSKARFGDRKSSKGFFPGAPDLAVEILSPSDSLIAAEAKVRMYLRAVCAVAWIMNPQDRTVRVYRAGEEVRLLGPADELDAEPVLPGFRCPVRRLFGQP